MQPPEKKSESLEGLSTKVTILIAIVALLPLMFVTGMVVSRYKQAYQARTRLHLEVLVQKHARMVDTFLAERLQTIALLARVCRCEELADPDFLNRRLADLHAAYGPVFQDIGFVNGGGRQVAYAGEYRLQNANYAGAGWFKEALVKTHYISDVFGGLRGFPHCIVSAIKICRGRKWILRATIDFSVFSSIVETLRFGRTGYAFIVNTKGEYQTRRSDIGTAGPRERYLKLTTPLKSGQWRLVAMQSREDAYADIQKIHKIAFGAFFLGLVASVVTAICVPVYILSRIRAKGR